MHVLLILWTLVCSIVETISRAFAGSTIIIFDIFSIELTSWEKLFGCFVASSRPAHETHFSHRIRR